MENNFNDDFTSKRMYALLYRGDHAYRYGDINSVKGITDGDSSLNSVGGFKVSGPFVETPCIFLCMQNINYAEISA